MRYIEKNQTPEELINWKARENENWRPTWENFQQPEKPLIHGILLQEQGYICCYCGGPVDLQESHIEHLKPKNHYPELALEYNNLLASCQGIKEDDQPSTIPEYCGHKKQDWYDEELMVSPLDINCAEFFCYTEAGEILPASELDENQQNAARETIERLGLNIDKLQRIRKQAIESILKFIDIENQTEIQQLIQGFDTVDNEGKYNPFCTVLTYILEQYINSSTEF